MDLSEFLGIYLKRFVIFCCLMKCSSTSNVKLNFYGVSKRDANASRRYHIVTPVKDFCCKNLNYDVTHLIRRSEPPPQLDEEKLFCENINNVSLISQNDHQQNLALSDSQGNSYSFYQFGSPSQSFKTNPCYHFKSRLKRQFQPLSPLFNNSNIIVNSSDSNITVTQLINITSGQSMVEIRENVVRVRVSSVRSNVRINPKENIVNISVASPFVVLNTSDRQSLDMTTSSSEIYVITQKGSQNYSIVADSGPTNMTVRQGTALIAAFADTRSKVTVKSYLPNVRDEIRITSRVIDQATFTRDIVMFGLTQNVQAEIQLVRGLLSIIYDRVQIRVSAVDHEILITTSVYTVRITTLLSPFTISVTDTVEVSVDNATVSVSPDTSNITGRIPYSLMQLRPDNATNIQLQTEQQGTSALSNANIDVESRNLTLEVIPSVPRIYAISIDSYAIINTSYSNIGLTANKSVIEVLSGTPYIRVLTGNTSIEVLSGGRPFTLSPGSRGTGVTFPSIITNLPVTPATPSSTPFESSSSSSSPFGVSTSPAPSLNSSSTLSPTNNPTLPTPTVSISSTISSSNNPTLPTPSLNISSTLSPTNNQSSSPNGNLSLTTVVSVSAQTPNISGQGEGGSSISPVDQTRLTLSTIEVSASTLTLFSSSSSGETVASSISSSSTISQTGAVSETPVSETTAASQSVLNSTSTLPLFNVTLSSISSSLPISSESSFSPILTVTTEAGSSRSPNIFPFPFPVIIPWPVPGQTTPISNGSVSATTSATESSLNTGSIESTTVTSSLTSTVSGVTGLLTTTFSLTGSTQIETITSSSGNLPSSISGESTTGGITGSEGTLSSTILSVNTTVASVSPEISLPTPQSFPVDTSTVSSGATVPPSNSSSADTPLPTLSPAGVNGTDQFVISQFSVSTLSPGPSVTLPLPNTAENGSVTQPVVLPEPPTFAVSPQTLSPNFSSVLSNTNEVVQNTLDVLQSSSTATGSSPVIFSNRPGEPSFLNAPPNEAYMLSVAVKVKRSLDSNAENFPKIIQNALKKAYVEGRSRQLGISSRRLKRKSNDVRRQVGSLNQTTKFDENSVDIRLISIDRPMSDEAKIRFYVLNDNNLVTAKKAKETFDQLGESELSAYLTYPVTEPVQPLPIVESSVSSSTPFVATSDSRAIVAILVTVGSLLIILAVICFILYKVKKSKPKFLSRKNSIASGASGTGVSETGDDALKKLKHGTLKEIVVGDNKILHHHNDKRLLLGDLPPLPSNGPKLIKEYSDRDLEAYDNMSYSELFEYVNTSQQPVNVTRRILSPRGLGNKVSPLTPLSPSPIYSKWGATHLRPPTSSQVTQVVRISPGTRRRLAKELLDSSFPLANANIDEVISGGRY